MPARPPAAKGHDSDRLARALRDNLRKRKAQARGRGAPDDSSKE
jgi:hypothetical protein